MLEPLPFLRVDRSSRATRAGEIHPNQAGDEYGAKAQATSSVASSTPNPRDQPHRKVVDCETERPAYLLDEGLKLSYWQLPLSTLRLTAGRRRLDGDVRGKLNTLLMAATNARLKASSY